MKMTEQEQSVLASSDHDRPEQPDKHETRPTGRGLLAATDRGDAHAITKTQSKKLSVLASSALLVLLAASLAPACKDSARPQTGSETHFLTRCDQSCEQGFDCVCGVCTKACTETASCE